MVDETYNGWTNYETWAVALWMDNDQGSYLYWRERAEGCFDDTDEDDGLDVRRPAAISALSDVIRDEHEDASPLGEQANVYSDLLTTALGEVDWYEIAAHLIDEVIDNATEE